MLHIFKRNGHRIAYDCAGRAAYPLSALAMKIVPSIEPPLTPDCPSSLRYAFAKYDSRDLSAAYAEIYALYEAGLLFAAGEAAAGSPAHRYTALRTSAAEAADKLTAASAAGAKEILLTLENAAADDPDRLAEIAGAAKVTWILQLDTDALSEAEIDSLNARGAYVLADAAALLSLADRGLRYLAADLPATEDGEKTAERLAKEFERRRREGEMIHFAPFDAALRARADWNAAQPGCADCWAREICGGKHLSDGQPTPACALERTLIECAVALEAEGE